MDKSIRVNDLIMLREDIPQHDLRADRIGRVLGVLASGEVELEFADENRRTIVKTPLRVEQIRVLRHEATLNAKGFWKLIDDARIQSKGDGLRYRELIVEFLEVLPIADIFTFLSIHSLYDDLANRHDLWKAAYIIGDFFESESDFWDFRDWLIEQGERVYYAALRDPESLADVVEANQYENYVFANVAGASYRAYEAKTGKSSGGLPVLHLPCTYEDYEIDTSFIQRPDDEWVYWELEEAIKKYPRLAAKFRPNYRADDLGEE